MMRTLRALTVGTLLLALAPVASAAADGAQFVSQNLATTMTPGAAYQVTVRFKNTGTTTWTRAAGYKLGSQNPRDNTRWGTNRIYLGNGESIAPGATKAFVFNVVAPAAPGSYDFQWRMVREGVTWFGPSSANIVVDVTGGVSGNCPAAIPGDGQPDHAALQACLDRGGQVVLQPGWYHLGQGLTLQHSGTVLRSADAASPAVLAARAGLTQPLLTVPSGRRDFRIEGIHFDGRRWLRQISRCGDGPGVRPGMYNVRMHGVSHFQLVRIESRNAACGTGLELSGADYEIRDSRFLRNGIDNRADIEGWADGLTALRCDRGSIHHNYFEDNTDIDLIIGGGRNCSVHHNTIVHRNRFGFGGLMVAHQSSGDHTGSVYSNNSVRALSGDRLLYGIMVGHHPWEPGLHLTNAGRVVDNSAQGAFVNLAVDGVFGGEILRNQLANPMGSRISNPLIVSCSLRPIDFTAAHVGNTCLQGGWDGWAYHNGNQKGHCAFAPGSVQSACPGDAEPTVQITQPAPGTVFTQFDVLAVRGTAADDRGVARVEVRIDGGPPQVASGTTSWRVFRPLFGRRGQVLIEVRAFDTLGQQSDPARVTITVVEDDPQP